ncbi:MAG: formate dehydrogenase accessory sulfurtransferase FdhD [Propionibacteriales bacterium]|nr:formate dehydrogenase accessory sulfurtransferase FdhD [Propionibacteriales bacterium]
MSLSKRPGPVTRRIVHEVLSDDVRRRPDSVVTEEPLEIRLGWPGQPLTRVVVTMRTPGSDFELAAGFLLSEGVLAVGQRPHTVAYCVDRDLDREQRYNVVSVTLGSPPLRHPGRRSTSMSSACGVCGAESLQEVFTPDDVPLKVVETVAPQVLHALPDILLARQPLFEATGAIHAAGVCTFDGEVIATREDIGRHNAVDKVLGARVLGTIAFGQDVVLCVSGRIGFDIITKAVAGRISTVVGVGGPSSLALDLAETAGITVCGFTRGSRSVAYTHPERIRRA